MLVEVEIKKDNPVENVVKVWRWAKGQKERNPMLFVQAFSAHYLGPASAPPAKAKQYVRAIFIGADG